MKKALVVCIAILCIKNVLAQNNLTSGRFIVYRHLKEVGVETFQLNVGADSTRQYTIDCNYTDRGSAVPLNASIRFAVDDSPLSLYIKGHTARAQQINDSITIEQNMVNIKRDSLRTKHLLLPNSFPIDGYAPATVQWLLVNYWLKNGKPQNINGLPNGQVTIKAMGKDTIVQNYQAEVLNAYAIKNVIWGWEYLWTDQAGALVGLITINAEGDKIAFMHQNYQQLLFSLTRLSATNGVKNYAAQNATPADLAITNGILVDIETGKESPHQTIIVKQGVIVWTGADKKANIPFGAARINANGKRMLPGLWDMHAHLKQTEWAPAYIAAGITTVRDMGNEFDFINTLKQNIDDGKGIGPTILRAGIIDGLGVRTNGIMTANTPEEAVALVQKYKAAGFDQIKLYGSLSPAIVPVICNEAHRLGLSVTGHIPTGITLEESISSGLNQVNHSTYIYRALREDTTTFDINLQSDQSKKVIQLLVDKHIVVDPTLAIFELLNRSLNAPITDIEPAFKQLPATLQMQLLPMGLPADAAIKRQQWFRAQQKIVFALFNAGVPIVAGTDMIIPGYSLYRELELYVDCGLTPLQALQTATKTPAVVMGKYKTSGSLVVGKQADIILVDGNPVEHISDIRKIALVIKAGKTYDPIAVHKTVGIE